MESLLSRSEGIVREDPIMAIFVFAAVVLLIGGLGWSALALDFTSLKSTPLYSYAKFFYASFLKPHAKHGDHEGQQAALESFYAKQVL